MELLTPSIGLIFWTALVFLILIFILGKFAWKPILNMVNERETRIEDALNEAKKARDEMKLLTVRNEEIMQEAREQRDIMLKEARDIRDRTIEESKDLAREEAAKIIEMAKVSIDNEKAAVMADIKAQVAEFSMGMAEKVLHKELENKDEQRNYVNSLIDNIKLN
ncbi:MAG: F0F1 ATP synthase subunit B [Weeksellaceae bacterium]|nr:F0F1 ATP synthase subunit B [Weeksellaceae bacterium]